MRSMPAMEPGSAEELAAVLQSAASKSRTIAVTGNNSKRLMGGPVLSADISISTGRLRRVLQYERDDLTISVESGMRFFDLQSLLARNGQMIALDPPFSDQSTVGGVVASNSSGPMRRAFGTARDLVIGMTFATLDGKLVKTGGMVVKNVAGLDMGKLMIGSFGTLAVMTSLNFRVHSLPAVTRTFLFTFSDLDLAIACRDRIIRSGLQPLAIDLISPAAAARLGSRGYLLAVRGSGSKAVLERYARDLEGSEALGNESEAKFWQSICDFSPDFLRRQPQAVVLRISTVLNEIGTLLKIVSGAAISRAGSGITYVYLTSWQGVSPFWNAALERGWSAVIEFAPDDVRGAKELWLSRPSRDAGTFAMMEKVKQMFDPGKLLNRSRLYGRI